MEKGVGVVGINQTWRNKQLKRMTERMLAFEGAGGAVEGVHVKREETV